MAKKGVIFLDTDTALREHPELFKQHFGTVVPPEDNKFAALNSAVWSGGSFIYIPEGVAVDVPLQAYFRINTQNMGQFERTLIIADKNSRLHYIEGCTAPIYSTDSLHSAVVEIIAKPGAHVRYTTIQNWSNDVYNLVTKRAYAHANATVEWVDGNLGSKLTMKYPSIYLLGPGAKGEILSVAFCRQESASGLWRKNRSLGTDDHFKDHFKIYIEGRGKNDIQRTSTRSQRRERREINCTLRRPPNGRVFEN